MTLKMFLDNHEVQKIQSCNHKSSMEEKDVDLRLPRRLIDRCIYIHTQRRVKEKDHGSYIKILRGQIHFIAG